MGYVMGNVLLATNLGTVGRYSHSFDIQWVMKYTNYLYQQSIMYKNSIDMVKLNNNNNNVHYITIENDYNSMIQLKYGPEMITLYSKWSCNV